MKQYTKHNDLTGKLWHLFINVSMDDLIGVLIYSFFVMSGLMTG